MTYTGTDATAGSEVHWYYGGVQASITKTTDASDNSNGYIALTGHKAEFGSVSLTVGGTVTFPTEYSDVSGNTLATEATGTQSIKYTGLAASQAIVINYLDISGNALAEVAMSQGVKVDFKIDELTEAVHGQTMKIKKTGATDGTASIDHLDYTPAFSAVFFGDNVTDASGNMKYSTKYNGAHKKNLVGKRYDSANTVTKKYFIFGAQPTGISNDMPESGMYKKSLSLAIDDYAEWESA